MIPEKLRRKIFLLALLPVWALQALSCASLPQPRTEDLNRTQALWPGLKLEDLVKGRELYVVHCSGCHSLRIPSQYSEARWQEIMERMQVKAKIDDGTKESLLKYLLTYAKRD